jgi:hypothetical protein
MARRKKVSVRLWSQTRIATSGESIAMLSRTGFRRAPDFRSSRLRPNPAERMRDAAVFA